MSYINPDERVRFDELLFDLGERIESPGQLNYVFSKLAAICLLAAEDNYETRNALMGVFACAAQEFYIQQVLPYESLKRDANGDLFAHDPLTTDDGTDG